MMIKIKLILVVMLSLIAVPAYSASERLSDPHQLVDDSAELVLSTIEEQRTINGDKVTAAMVQELIEVLDPIVDFHAIAKAVIGKHSNILSSEQARIFGEVFRTTMVRLYLESFVAFEVAEIEVQPPEASFDIDSGRATVRMIASASNGTAYQINYSMRTNDSKEWKIRNVVVDGINLGLTYRNQFDGAMNRYNMNAEQVIANWDEDAVIE